MFVKFTMVDGTTYVSEFSKLTNLGRYATKCFSTRKAFNVWTQVVTPHAQTFEPITMRTRTLLNPEHVRSIEQVDAAGVPVQTPQRDGRLPLYTVTETDGTHLPVGTVVPMHRDPLTLEQYVITGYNPEGGELRHTFSATLEREDSEHDDFADEETF